VYNLTEEYFESDSQYIWKTDNDTNVTSILSNKTVVELSSLDGIKNKNDLTSAIPIYTAFEFWSKKSMRNVTKLSNKKIIDVNEFYELHSQLILSNVDVTDWTSDSIVSFKIGVHITRD
jgi:hypothetical protein